eukprot:3767668-Rhodomonas_salina.1
MAEARCSCVDYAQGSMARIGVGTAEGTARAACCRCTAHHLRMVLRARSVGGVEQRRQRAGKAVCDRR